jgi:hypothetical protein
MQKRINCVKCLYYYVTWQPQTPHGCKAFGFRSKSMPSQEVFKNSGKACDLYKEKG